jgi:hypothetical protein
VRATTRIASSLLRSARTSFPLALATSIWGLWSNRVRLKVTGSSAFAKQFAPAGVPINFDLRWVTTGSHWEVNAYKTPPGTPVEQYHQTVAFSTRTINLYTSKLVRYTAANDAGAAGQNLFGSITLADRAQPSVRNGHLASNVSRLSLTRLARALGRLRPGRELDLCSGSTFAGCAVVRSARAEAPRQLRVLHRFSSGPA